MKRSRFVVELISEIVLGVSLLLIAGFSMFATFQLNPVGSTSNEPEPVLGQSSRSWVVLHDKNFHSIIISDNSEELVLKLFLRSAPQSTVTRYNFISVTNDLPREQKYSLKMIFDNRKFNNYLLFTIINKTETAIFNAHAGNEVKDLILDVPANTAFTIGLKLQAYEGTITDNSEMNVQLTSLTFRD